MFKFSWAKALIFFKVIRHQGPTLTFTVALLVFAILGIFVGNENPSKLLVVAVIVLGVAAFIATYVQGYRDTKEAGMLEPLEKEETGSPPLDYLECLNSHLAVTAIHTLRLDASDRVSIYSADAGKFWMQGRYSANPSFERRGRAWYPIDQGCIGAAWQSLSGSCFIGSLPDPETEPEAYFEILKTQHQIPKGVSRNFQMKSRCLVAFVVYDKAKEHGQAVVVIESMIPNRFDFAEINRKWKDEGMERTLSNLLEVMKPIRPESTYATERGI